ncbi:MAG: YjbQ family protein [Caldiserica bacterium]|nr:MAG: YjbQ family protein [Caldisericota bacterium]
MLKSISLKTHKRVEAIDITDEISKLVKESGVERGICIVFVPHTTASITINENADPSVIRDILSTLSELIPYNKTYTHLEGNADAHIKSSITGSSREIIIESGKLLLGTWQGVFFLEFDGPRTRKVFVKVIKG